MKTLDLRPGLSDNAQYKAFKFPGGEVHFQLLYPLFYYETKHLRIVSSITNSDELILLILVIDTIRKDNYVGAIEVFIPYFPYQQADRDFSLGESFSLKTITTILNSLDVDKYVVFDAHSDVTPALLKKCKVIDNSEFIKFVLADIDSSNLTLLSPDAGAYKKIGKLADKIAFKGDVAAANKYRNTSSGNIDSVELSKTDFQGSDILIVDDICMGGRTFVELAKKLKERNVGKLYLAISHGIFNHGTTELREYFDEIYSTDSRSYLLETNPSKVYKII